MEGEDISPAVALASTVGIDPFTDAENIVNFGSGSQFEENPSQTPTASSTATATATSAPNSPASATSNSTTAGSTGTGTAAASSGLSLDWILLISGVALAALIALFFILRR